MTLVAFVLVLVPWGALGGAAHAGKSPPYRGTAWVPNVSVNHGGCGVAKLSPKPSWSGTTGAISLGVAAGANYCASTTAAGVTNSASATSEVYVAIPISFATSGNHTLKASWTMVLQVNQSVSLNSTCPVASKNPTLYQYAYCSVDVYAGLYAYAHLTDLNNSSSVWQTNAWNPLYNDTSYYVNSGCYGGSCNTYHNLNHQWSGNGSLSGTTTWTWIFNADGRQAVNASHRYALIIDLSASVRIYEYGNPIGFSGGGASVSIDMASPSHDWKLTSLRIV